MPRQCPRCAMQIDDALRFCPADGTPVVPVEVDPYVGKVILGRYRLDARIGHGGMGSVYRGEHVLMGKTVALKLLHGDMSRVPQAVKRFEREARSMSKLDHPNLVGATDFGETEDGILFLVLEYLEGPTLAKLLRDVKRFDIRRALKIGRQMLAALQSAHGQGIVHRDLKPDNVILVERDDDHEFVKILDFGIAKMLHDDNEPETLTRTGMVFGTPEYLSPEQGLGQHADHRADLYSMSVILYEMLTGVRPFRAENKLDLIAQHLTADAEPMSRLAPGAEIPHALDEIVKKGLAKKPDDRYPDAQTYSKVLEEISSALDDPLSAKGGLLAPATKTGTTRTMRAIGETARDAGRVMGSTLGRLATRAFWRSLRAGGWQRPDAVASLALGMLLLLSMITASVLLTVDFGADASERSDGVDDDDPSGSGTGSGAVITLGVNPILKARKLSMDGKHAEALTVLKAALVDAPLDPEVHRTMGEVSEALGRWGDAAVSYREAMRLKPALRADERIIGAAMMRFEGAGKEFADAQSLIEEVIKEPALPKLRAALVSSHKRVVELRGKARNSIEARKTLPEDLKKELDRARRLRVNARRTLEHMGDTTVDVIPIVLDEMRDLAICAEIKAYVNKLEKLADVRALPTLESLHKTGYAPKGGNPCLKTAVPAAIAAVTPK